MAKFEILKNICLKNFRNYTDFELNNFGDFNILVGQNAIGKTNILEAISLLTQVSSFRAVHTEDLLNQNISADIANIQAKFLKADSVSNDSRENHVIDQLMMSIKDNKKTYFYNQKKSNIASLKGVFPSVVFTPDDLMTVKGSNSLRRDAIDSIGCQMSKDYFKVYRDYKQAHRQKNKILKDFNDETLVSSINDAIIVAGAQLIRYRCALINKLLPEICHYYNEISHNKEKLSIDYYPSWDDRNSISEISRDEARLKLKMALENNLENEIRKKYSIIGPHIDKIKFSIDDRDASKFASQGQQRSLILAFKLSECMIIEKKLGVRPILLLDDVMSELDVYRRNKLLKFIKGNMQVFLTTTSLEYFESDFLSDVNVIDLKGLHAG